MTQGIHSLTNAELTAQLSIRDDLSELEHELCDRLIRACDAISDLEQQLWRVAPATAPATETTG